MPAAFAHRPPPEAHFTGHPWRARPWRLVASLGLAALLRALLGPSAALAHPPGTTQRVSVSSDEEQANASSGGAAITPDGLLVAFGSSATNLVPGDVEDFAGDVYLRDRQTQTTVRSSVRTDGTETGFELGSLNAALSADGQVVAFESEGALVPEDSEFPVDVFVHDEQP